MSAISNIGSLAVAAFLGFLCTGVRADDPAPANDDKPLVRTLIGDETDWLIQRRDGQWELVAKGPTGRVHKEYSNQEVLRMGESGSFVEVVSMPPIYAGDETMCSQRARRDARDLCSSRFLACRPDSDGKGLSLALFLIGASNAADRRNRLACRVDIEGILQAAKDVGMIQRILPRTDVPQ